MKNNREKILMIVGIITLLIFIGGATFAYFIAQDGNAEQTNINVTTHTTDSLVFEVGKAISITADQTTFAQGAGNRSDDTFARATLKANSSTNSATANYYVYLNIDINEFKYTTDTKTAELILTVNYKDTNGNITPVTSINGLNYVTVGEVSGFDITESNGLITIANNYEITSSGTEVDEWDITLTLVNLDANQNDNSGKSFNGTLLIQKNSRDFANYIKSLYTTQGENGLYYHDKTFGGGAADNSYRYSTVLLGLDTVELDETLFRQLHFENLDVHVGGFDISGDLDLFFYKEWLSNMGVENYTDEQLKEMFMGAIAKIVNNEELASNEYILVSMAMSAFKSEKDAMMDAYAKGLTDRITEISIDNYVCFGSEETICPENNLYRIIGVFEDKVKLVKDKSIGEMVWNTNDKNDWSTSTLASYLNNDFLNTLGDYSKKIALSSWNIGESNISFTTTTSADSVFVSEQKEKKLFEAKVGLIYASDYAYANNIEGWNNVLNDPDIIVPSPVNWFNYGNSKWLINKTIYGANYTDGNYIGYNYENVSSSMFEVNPSFYLESSAMFIGGTGTASDPYRIS